MNFVLDAETLRIIGTTLTMAFSSTAIGSALGIVLGILLQRSSFPGKNLVVRLCRTLMGAPPVVVGLVVYLLLMRRGPLGFLGWIFTVRGMVLAQVIIITPIVCGMVYSYAARCAGQIEAFALSMGANRFRRRILLIRELRAEIYFSVIAAFGRAISEVGAVMIVGGNIQGRTRTMTTAISMMQGMGDQGRAITLGIALLVMAFLIQCLSDFLRRERPAEENL